MGSSFTTTYPMTNEGKSRIDLTGLLVQPVGCCCLQ